MSSRVLTGIALGLVLATLAFAVAGALRVQHGLQTGTEAGSGSQPPHAPRPGTSQLRVLEIDAAASTGRIRSLQGANGAPAPGFHKPEDFRFGGWNIPQDWDVTDGYRSARIDLVRTHDAYGPGDIDPVFGPEHGAPGSVIAAERTLLAIFPDPNADPRDPKSYNFGPTDALVASIRSAGAEVLFRLGRSESSDTRPPKSFDRYAEVVKRIVMHYNQGWADGFQHGIRYWEIWNEPDLGRLFWGGTPEQFHQLYGKLALAVKAADPQALVGGPALARINDPGPYREGFLDYVRAHKLPLDFFTWHWYATDSNDPLDIVRIGMEVRALLDARGFQSTQSFVDEWNYGLMEPLPEDLQRAAFVASTMIYMQDSPIDRSALYRADNLFGADGKAPNKTGLALVALGRMLDTPERLDVTGGDRDGLAVLAGRSEDGASVQVLISNYEVPAPFRGQRTGEDRLRIGDLFDVGLLPRRSFTYRDNSGYDLGIRGLPAEDLIVERYRVSGADNLTLVERRRERGPNLRVRAALPPPALELLVIGRAR